MLQLATVVPNVVLGVETEKNDIGSVGTADLSVEQILLQGPVPADAEVDHLGIDAFVPEGLLEEPRKRLLETHRVGLHEGITQNQNAWPLLGLGTTLHVPEAGRVVSDVDVSSIDPVAEARAGFQHPTEARMRNAVLCPHAGAVGEATPKCELRGPETETQSGHRDEELRSAPKTPHDSGWKQMTGRSTDCAESRQFPGASDREGLLASGA